MTWEAVRLSDQNGDITGYTVYYRAIKGADESGEEQQKVVFDGRATDTELTSLEEYVEYSIKVLAFNGAGDGPKSAAVYKRTREGSTYLSKYIVPQTYVRVLQWISLTLAF